MSTLRQRGWRYNNSDNKNKNQCHEEEEENVKEEEEVNHIPAVDKEEICIPAINPIEKPLSQNDHVFPGITGAHDDGCKSHGMTMPPPAADAAAAAALTLLQAQLL